MLDDGKLDTESDSGEFWVLFGGFAPIGKKVVSEDDIIPETTPAKLYRYYDLIWFCLCILVELRDLKINVELWFFLFLSFTFVAYTWKC